MGPGKMAKHTCTHTHHTCTDSHAHACVRTHTHRLAYTCAHTCTDSHTHAHMHTHTSLLASPSSASFPQSPTEWAGRRGGGGCTENRNASLAWSSLPLLSQTRPLGAALSLPVPPAPPAHQQPTMLTPPKAALPLDVPVEAACATPVLGEFPLPSQLDARGSPAGSPAPQAPRGLRSKPWGWFTTHLASPGKFKAERGALAALPAAKRPPPLGSGLLCLLDCSPPSLTLSPGPPVGGDGRGVSAVPRTDRAWLGHRSCMQCTGGVRDLPLAVWPWAVPLQGPGDQRPPQALLTSRWSLSSSSSLL